MTSASGGKVSYIFSVDAVIVLKMACAFDESFTSSAGLISSQEIFAKFVMMINRLPSKEKGGL